MSLMDYIVVRPFCDYPPDVPKFEPSLTEFGAGYNAFTPASEYGPIVLPAHAD